MVPPDLAGVAKELYYSFIFLDCFQKNTLSIRKNRINKKVLR